MATDPPTSSNDVFINCPFDAEFAPIFDALVFTVLACGFQVRTARELDDGGQTRIEKLYEIIQESRYGIHDLSRTQLDINNGLPRFNMPFELGLFLGAKRFGGDGQKAKRCLVLDTEPFRYQMFISDLAGIDPRPHGNDPEVAIIQVRNWLANVSRRKLVGPQRVVDAHHQFEADRPGIIAALGFLPDAVPYFDLVEIMAQWLHEAAPA